MEEKNKKQLLDEDDLEDVNGGDVLSAEFFSCRTEKKDYRPSFCLSECTWEMIRLVMAIVAAVAALGCLMLIM